MVLLIDTLLKDRIGRVLLVDHLVVHVHHPFLQARQIQTGSRGTVESNRMLLIDRGYCHRVGIAVLGET